MRATAADSLHVRVLCLIELSCSAFKFSSPATSCSELRNMLLSGSDRLRDRNESQGSHCPETVRPR
jgi:hypothetical protein